MNPSSDYWDMVKAWKAIIAGPLPDERKTEGCLAILQKYLNELALFRARQANPPLRFYADMLTPRRHFFPFGVGDEFGQLVILPLYRAVDEWLQEHTEMPQYHSARRAVAGERPKAGGIVAALRHSPLVGADLDINRSRERDRKIDL